MRFHSETLFAFDFSPTLSSLCLRLISLVYCLNISREMEEVMPKNSGDMVPLIVLATLT